MPLPDRSARDPQLLSPHLAHICTQAFSPNGATLAVGSADCSVTLHPTDTFQPAARCNGCSGALMSLDWRADGAALQATDRAHELLYFLVPPGTATAAGVAARSRAEAGAVVALSSTPASQQDAVWADWTATLGFPVMGAPVRRPPHSPLAPSAAMA